MVEAVEFGGEGTQVRVLASSLCAYVIVFLARDGGQDEESRSLVYGAARSIRMISHRLGTVVVVGVAIILPILSPGPAALAGVSGPIFTAKPGAAAVRAVPARDGRCLPGARTLSRFGSHLYPATGNGRYPTLPPERHLAYPPPT